MFESNELECGLQGDLKSFGNVLGQVVNGLPDIFRTEGIGEHTIEGGTAIGCGLELIDVSGTAITDINVLPDFQFEGWAINCYLQFTNGTVILSADSITNCVTNPQACMGGGGEPEPDSDGDGFADDNDNCPNVPNDQTNTDGDDKGDACDVSKSPDPDATTVTVALTEHFHWLLEEGEYQSNKMRAEQQADLVVGAEQWAEVHPGTQVTISGQGDRKRIERALGGTDNPLFIVPDGAHLILENLEISGIQGGVVEVQPGGRFTAIDVWFTNNENPNGGVINATLDSSGLAGALPALDIGCSADNDDERCCLFEGNAGNECGAVCIYSDDGLVEIGDRAEPLVDISGCGFFNNTVDIGACDIHSDAFTCADSEVCVSITNNHFSSSCGGPSISVDGGNPLLGGNSLDRADGDDGGALSIDPPPESEPKTTTILDEVEHSLVITRQSADGASRAKSQQAASACSPGTEVNSLGYNLSTDTSCGFDHATDLENADPMKGPPDANGIRAPLAGSPLIDHGPSELIQFDGALWPSLPCGFRDIYGLGRPQDGDGDGEYECDIGAVEFPGPGEIVPGHSGAFIDPLLDGEGQFVQVIDENTAAIFTFTYRMDGSGPAWFLGVADIVGNSLVVNDLLRPVGTSFGDDFDAGDVWLTPAGGMSMIFSSCESQNVPGRVVYSGSPALGYQPLISEAQRLTGYVACADGGLAPSPNAALSGPFGDLARNGEGLVIQWLPGGVVAAVFFTYDFENNQMWVVASGIAEGKTVEMGAFYPTSFPAWGSEPNPANVQITPWGSFTLEYIDCDTVRFTYTSTVPGFGSGEYILKRIAALAGTECPEF